MNRHTAMVRAIVLAAALSSVSGAAAQTLGPFTWQLQPHCNVITVRATPIPQATPVPQTWHIEGTDDMCGTGLPVPFTGTAGPGPAGVIAIDFHTPGLNGLFTYTRGELLPAVLRGSWTDSQGRSGIMEFGVVGPVSGTLRSLPLVRGTDISDGAIGAVDINPVEVQRRITGSCGVGQFAQSVAQDGLLSCGTPSGGGDITGVIAGLGLTGGALSGDVTIGIDLAAVQARIGSSCPQGVFMTGASAAGVPTCTDGVAAGAGTTGFGASALASNTGDENTAVGENALGLNTAGYKNTAFGDDALWQNTSGLENTAVGDDALTRNSGGYANTGLGQGALYANTSGHQNTAVGQAALGSNMAGSDNTAVGDDALRGHAAGDRNTVVGAAAMQLSAFGSDNVVVGHQAMRNAGGSRNIVIGSGAGASGGGDDNILIGNTGGVAATPTIRIGNPVVHTRAFVAGIFGATAGGNNSVPVLIDSNGQLGTISSSRRYKTDIADMADASAGVLRLRPVTFRYRQGYGDGSTPPEYGLIAEEVAEVYPDLVASNAKGEVETVQYHKLTPMLLNELQRQVRVTDRQAREIERLHTALAALEARINDSDSRQHSPRR